ncbi:hypothetical protein GCM10027020_09630 [Nocardioides salsibiostraticola]
MADDNNVDVRKLRNLIKRYALLGNLTADEVLSLGTNASDEQGAWARALVDEMPERSKPWATEFGRPTCQNSCCNPWAGQSTTYDPTGGLDPWAES